MRFGNLCKELSIFVTSAFGAAPPAFGKTGVTHPDLLCNKTISIIEDGKKVSKALYFGHSNDTEVLLVRLSEDPHEIALVIKTPSSVIGFQHVWDGEDVGKFLVRAEDKWIACDLSQKLRIALGAELLVQEGVLWSPGKVPEAVRDLLVALVDADIDTGSEG